MKCVCCSCLFSTQASRIVRIKLSGPLGQWSPTVDRTVTGWFCLWVGLDEVLHPDLLHHPQIWGFTPPKSLQFWTNHKYDDELKQWPMTMLMMMMKVRWWACSFPSRLTDPSEHRSMLHVCILPLVLMSVQWDVETAPLPSVLALRHQKCLPS